MSAAPSRVVLITGAAGGLGRALTRAFLSDGWRAIAASRGEQSSENEKFVEQFDITNAEEVRARVEEIVSRHGRIDCLINNAGTTSDALLIQLEEGEWDHVLNVNLRAAFFCARSVARQMAKQRDGHIINISSFSGRVGARGQSNYAASKAGLIGLTQSLAKELGSRNVRVNAVLPGVLPTNMTAQLTLEELQQFAQANTLGRINSLDEVARFIVFLASTQNISGQVFQLDSRIAPWT